MKKLIIAFMMMVSTASFAEEEKKLVRTVHECMPAELGVKYLQEFKQNIVAVFISHRSLEGKSLRQEVFILQDQESDDVIMLERFGEYMCMTANGHGLKIRYGKLSS